MFASCASCFRSRNNRESEVSYHLFTEGECESEARIYGEPSCSFCIKQCSVSSVPSLAPKACGLINTDTITDTKARHWGRGYGKDPHL